MALLRLLQMLLLRTTRDREPRTATSTFTQLLSSVCQLSLLLKCCYTSAETVRTIRNGEPTTATSTSTQLLSSEGDEHYSVHVITMSS